MPINMADADPAVDDQVRGPHAGLAIDAHARLRSWFDEALKTERMCFIQGLEERHRLMLAELAGHLAGSHVHAAVYSPAPSVGKISLHSANHSIIALSEELPANASPQSHASPDPFTSTERLDPCTDSLEMRGGERDNTASVSMCASTQSKGKGCTLGRRDTLNLASKADQSSAGHISGPFGLAACITKVVKSPQFEIFFGAMILLNTVIMALEAQYYGIESGFVVGYPKSVVNAADSWPWAARFLSITETMFGSLFTLELGMKILGLQHRFARDIWNWIDSVIVLAWLVTSVGTAQLPLNPMLLRLARLIRLLRLLRLVKTIQGFDSLYLMTTAIKGSVSILVWAVVLLAMIQMIFALLLQQLLVGYIEDESVSQEQRHEVYMYYGSFTRTMLSMFEITLGNWMPPCRALVENVSEYYMVFAVLHKFIIGFSVLAVIQGVFIQETFKVSTTDDTIMMIQKERAIKLHEVKMTALFERADESGDGSLDADEFQAVVGDPCVKTWLAAMELDVIDAQILFDLIDNGDSKITAKELLQGVARLKGFARSIDLVTLLHESRQNREVCNQIFETLHELRQAQAVVEQMHEKLNINPSNSKQEEYLEYEL